MMSISESMLSCIDDVNLTEFQSVISVCESLVENYEKAAEIILYSHETDCSRYNVFIESFISEEDESWWRKNKSNGKRENIIISILLLPLRIIQALIKLIKKSRIKEESKSLDKKLDKIEEMKEKNEIDVESVSTEQWVSQPSPEKGGEKKKVKVVAKIDTTGPEIEIETNVDVEDTKEALEAANKGIMSEKEFFDTMLTEDNIEKVIKDGLNNGTINRVQAKHIMDLVHYDPNNKKRTTVSQFKSNKKESMNLLERTEKVCEEYQKSIERILVALRDHPSGDNDVDTEVARRLTELYHESKNLVIATSEGLLYLEGVINACNQAADMIINGKE